jgi:hypothetical protein
MSAGKGLCTFPRITEPTILGSKSTRRIGIRIQNVNKNKVLAL